MVQLSLELFLYPHNTDLSGDPISPAPAGAKCCLISIWAIFDLLIGFRQDTLFFYGCNILNYFTIEGAVFENTGLYTLYEAFCNCWGLREVDSSFLKLLRVKRAGGYYGGCTRVFYGCYSIDRIVAFGVPISSSSQTHTGNFYIETFNKCYRLDELTFETNDDGTPKELYANNQVIDLSNNVGYCPSD